jgi:hypothetical protein
MRAGVRPALVSHVGCAHPNVRMVLPDGRSHRGALLTLRPESMPPGCAEHSEGPQSSKARPLDACTVKNNLQALCDSWPSSPTC